METTVIRIRKDDFSRFQPEDVGNCSTLDLTGRGELNFVCFSKLGDCFFTLQLNSYVGVGSPNLVLDRKASGCLPMKSHMQSFAAKMQGKWSNHSCFEMTLDY